MSAALEAHNLSRTFGRYEALQPTDLRLEGGEVIVLQGPNGAGKSTLLYCLSGLLRPSSGRVMVEGFDLYEDEREAKRRLAFVPDVPRFYSSLTAWEHLQFMALAHGVQSFEARASELLRRFGLWQARELFPHALSRGMRLKLGLLLAFIRPFDVLLLDEPTSALDQDSVRLVGDLLGAYRQEGRAILLTSHDPELAKTIEAAAVWQMRDGQLASA